MSPTTDTVPTLTISITITIRVRHNHITSPEAEAEDVTFLVDAATDVAGVDVARIVVDTTMSITMAITMDIPMDTPPTITPLTTINPPPIPITIDPGDAIQVMTIILMIMDAMITIGPSRILTIRSTTNIPSHHIVTTLLTMSKRKTTSWTFHGTPRPFPFPTARTMPQCLPLQHRPTHPLGRTLPPSKWSMNMNMSMSMRSRQWLI
jgi:hypothetical protein